MIHAIAMERIRTNSCRMAGVEKGRWPCVALPFADHYLKDRYREDSKRLFVLKYGTYSVSLALVMQYWFCALTVLFFSSLLVKDLGKVACMHMFRLFESLGTF